MFERNVWVVTGLNLFLCSVVFAYSGGSGEPNNPWQVGTVSDWQQLMNTPADWNKPFIMTADVNLQGVTLTPVGSSTNNFKGIFDGNDHIICNAKINMPTTYYIGLFGYIGQNSQIRNLGVEDINIIGGIIVGGLVGYNYKGTINNCYVTGAIDGKMWIGGLAGKNSGNITACYTTGAVIGSSNASSSATIGGLVGGNGEENINANISDCYSTCAVSGVHDCIGGLVGYNYSGCAIINCYAKGTVTVASGGNIDYIGGLAGYNASRGTIINCYASGDVSGGSNSNYIGGLVGQNWAGTINGCYASGDVISGSGSHYVGGFVGSTSISGAIITDCYATGNVAGRNNIGGFAGANGEGKINRCYAKGSVDGNNNVGGLVGYSGNTNTVVAINNCYATGPVDGNDYVGGLVGYNWSHSGINASYSTGAVVGDSNVGGLVGYDDDAYGPITACFWDVNTSGQTSGDGGTGKTTTQMQDINTFLIAGWDFTTPIWEICNNMNYPKLAWQTPLIGDFVCPDGVALEDLDYFVDRWLNTNCAVTNDCDGTDIYKDGIVNFLDFSLFAENWMKQ